MPHALHNAVIFSVAGFIVSSFSIKERLTSFSYAFAGIAHLIRHEHNAWVHLAATLVSVSAGFYFEIDRVDWALVILAISLVWLGEGLNTAVELLANAITTEQHPLIGHAKDVAAGAVLISALGAAVIGLLVFLPKLLA